LEVEEVEEGCVVHGGHGSSEGLQHTVERRLLSYQVGRRPGKTEKGGVKLQEEKATTLRRVLLARSRAKGRGTWWERLRA